MNDFGRKMDTNDYPNQEYEGDGSRRYGNGEAYENNEGEYSMNGEHLLHPMDITDEYALDGEVGRRLNQMVPVPVSLFIPFYKKRFLCTGIFFQCFCILVLPYVLLSAPFLSPNKKKAKDKRMELIK